ncbi:HAMP domain-containing histidine kinase [Gracilibacillus oryzae]|uniref:histidine kinase n=1 Tax=Gracilibacillus oryzae TaxID=1672701 RepID=A0A7C8KUB6_9BACI|nr:HAMP domain-containing sensor histidine kinase [Gracilibacillus oryzae]KAB8139127.1 HAMP domain-containing histidine kinase [Gracilibacillus oryzae]
MLNKLSFKIGLLFFIFILIIESVLFFVLYTNLVNDRIDEVMESILARGNTHRDVLEDNYNRSTMRHVGIMESTSSYIVIITDDSGNVIVSSDPVEQEMLRVINHVDGEVVPSEGKIIEDRWKQKEYIATESPITIDGEHKGHVFMFADTGTVRKIVEQLNSQFIVVGIITVILTILTVFILSRFITIPLVKMKEATEQLSLGMNKVELHTERKDELGELANAITKLSNDLEQLKMARNEFLANISHELRTPLTYIKGYADIVNRQDTSEKDKKEYISIIREETEQLALLIKNLFELAKMDQNKFTIKQEEVILHELIHTVIDRISPVYEEKNIDLTTSCPRNIIACVDPERFQQVLINILDNARKHTFNGGQVSLSVNQSDQETSIIITDNGEGIPKEDLPYIFDRLYRVEKSRSRQSGGTGLGLAIAKEIVESHEGTIKINSKQGKGTNVIIRLKRGGT